MVDLLWVIKNNISLLPYRLGSSYAFKPQSISLGVNSDCNSKCLMCDIGLSNRGEKLDSKFMRMLNRKRELSLDNIDFIISKIKSFRPDIHINTTEPLMHPQIEKIIEHLRAANLKVKLTTNGLLLKNKAKELANSGLNELTISIDGYDELHNEIRGIPRMFKLVKDGVDELRSYKDIPLRINFTINPLNYDKVYRSVISINDEFKPKKVVVSHMNYIDENMKKIHNLRFGKDFPVDTTCVAALSPSTVDTKILSQELDKVKSIENVAFYPDLTDAELDIYYKTNKLLKAHSECKVPWKHFQISADGTVYVMTRCFDYSLGNILTQDLDEIWNGPRIHKLRRNLLKCNGAMPACARCCAIY